MPILPTIINRPLMVEQKFLDTFIASKTVDLEKKAALFAAKSKNYIKKNNSAIIPILGPISQRLDFWTWLFGGAAYDSIRADFQEALSDSEVETIIFEIDSPGGTVAGVFDLVDEIRAARGQKKMIAMINETAYSAAYAIASAADEVYLPRTGGAGSIGVIAIHTDLSKFEHDIGVKYTAIYAGARKNDFTPHEPLSDEAYKVIKAEVDDIYKIFIDTVAKNRGLDKETIRNMEAGIYQGKKAVDMGLADGVKTFTQVLKKGGRRMSKTLLQALQETIKEAKPEELQKAMLELGYVPKEGMVSKAEMDKALNAKEADYVKLLDDEKKATTKKVREDERASIVSILELCSISDMQKMGLKLIQENVSLEDARKRIMDAKVPKQTIISTVNPLHSGEENPLLADAKRRAGDQKK